MGEFPLKDLASFYLLGGRKESLDFSPLLFHRYRTLTYRIFKSYGCEESVDLRFMRGETYYQQGAWVDLQVGKKPEIGIDLEYLVINFKISNDIEYYAKRLKGFRFKSIAQYVVFALLHELGHFFDSDKVGVQDYMTLYSEDIKNKHHDELEQEKYADWWALKELSKWKRYWEGL